MKDRKLRIFIIQVLLGSCAAILTMVTGMIARGGLAFTIGEVTLNSTQIAGVITAIRLILYVLLLLVERKSGFIIDALLLIYGSMGMLINVFKLKVYDSIPGLANMIATLLISIVLYFFLYNREKQRKAILDLSERDTLTGLFNRRALIRKVDELVGLKKVFHVASISIENFRKLSDTMGYSFSDKTMVEVAWRVSDLCTEGEFAAILGSSNILFVSREADKNKFVERVLAITAEIKKPIIVDDTVVKCETFASAVAFPDNGTESGTLFRHLDTIRASRSDRSADRVFFIDDSVSEEVAESIAIEDRIIEALQKEELKLVFQPQYIARGKKLRGFETLSRLDDKEGRPIRPDKFIKIAEKSNLIYKVDEYVLNHALAAMKPLIKQSGDFVVSVNISASHFAVDGFVEMVEEALKKHNFPARQLEIEVTETVFADHLEKVKASITKLRAMSIKIALDDFGTGYASLSYLSLLPLDVLKIDKFFVDKLGQNDTADDFILVIISIARIMKLEIVAEGVENDEQLDSLRSWGCDFIQGYVWGRPMPIEQASELI